MVHQAWARSWSAGGGVVMALAGLGLAGGGWLMGSVPLGLTVGVLMAGALLELASGEWLRRHRGAGLAHEFSGPMMLGFAVCLGAAWQFQGEAFSAAPVAMMFGVYCLANAIFRGLDAAIDRPLALWSEVIDVSVTLLVAVLVLQDWRAVTNSGLALAAGVELLAGSVSMLGAGWAAWQHPERGAYASDVLPSH